MSVFIFSFSLIFGVFSFFFFPFPEKKKKENKGGKNRKCVCSVHEPMHTHCPTTRCRDARGIVHILSLSTYIYIRAREDAHPHAARQDFTLEVADVPGRKGLAPVQSRDMYWPCFSFFFFFFPTSTITMIIMIIITIHHRWMPHCGEEWPSLAVIAHRIGNRRERVPSRQPAFHQSNRQKGKCMQPRCRLVVSAARGSIAQNAIARLSRSVESPCKSASRARKRQARANKRMPWRERAPACFIF